MLSPAMIFIMIVILIFKFVDILAIASLNDRIETLEGRKPKE